MWYTNYVVFEHADKSELEKLISSFNNDCLFETYIPVPEDLKNTKAECPLTSQQLKNIDNYGYADWHSFCHNEWGTAWDIGAKSDKNKIVAQENNKIIIKFDTVDMPPIMFYYYLVENIDFDIQAYYCGEDKKHCGVYTKKNGVRNYTIGEQKIPLLLDELFGINS